MRLRRGWLQNNFTAITWAPECPIHAGETNLEYPVGCQVINLSGHVESMMEQFYCPQGGGHSFPVEEAKVTIFNDLGQIVASGQNLGGTFAQY
jgi:hypothetical protein